MRRLLFSISFVLALLIIPFVAFALEVAEPSLPSDLGALGAVIIGAVQGDVAWWVVASIAVFGLVQIFKGKLFAIPLVTGLLEKMPPLARLLVIGLGTVAAFVLLAIPGGTEAIVAGALAGLQVAAGAVMAHSGWKLASTPAAPEAPAAGDE